MAIDFKVETKEDCLALTVTQDGVEVAQYVLAWNVLENEACQPSELEIMLCRENPGSEVPGHTLHYSSSEIFT